MTELVVYDVADPGTPIETTSDPDRIAAVVQSIGAQFERWDAAAELSADADSGAVLAAYAGDIDRLKSLGGYQTADVMRMQPDHPDKEALRAKFCQEHTHSEDEVRFFVEGSGLFFLRADDKVYQIRCERNDLLLVPTGMRHWFDAGDAPEFTVIRLFTDTKGWIADYTGDDIAGRIQTAA